MGGKTGTPKPPVPVGFTTLPPPLITRILTFLPVCELGKVARLSRRVKILSYSDEVFLPKLRCLNVSLVDPATIQGTESLSVSETGAPTAGGENDESQKEMEKLAQKLKQLPGGNMISSGKYLETGSLFGGTASFVDESVVEEVPVSSSIAASPHDSAKDTTGETPISKGPLISLSESGTAESSPAVSPEAQSAPYVHDLSNTPPTTVPSDNTNGMKISSTLPTMKKSNIIVGAGGLKAAGKSSSSISIGGTNTRSKSPSMSRPSTTTNLSTKPTRLVDGTVFYPHLRNLRPRDAFKQIFTELLPYYMDFHSHAKDSKIFRDHKDMIVVSQLLRRVFLFSRAKLILDVDDINFALDTTIEWYESMLLGQFERAYDAKQIPEMKRNTIACWELNGGASCVNLFCSKNPIFFDSTFNPSLVASKLPSLVTSTAEARGYALGDDFARFIDHTLASCAEQASVVSQVFPSEMHAMTVFVGRVFEDSISPYLTAVLTCAREGEGVSIYLHTLAISVHCCSQFLDHISVAESKVKVNTVSTRESMRKIFAKDWEKYLSVELDYLTKRMDAELKKWKNRKDRVGSPRRPSAFLADSEKAMQHKREVLSTMKKVLFAPVALGKAVGNTLLGNRYKAQAESLLDSPEATSPTSPIGNLSPLAAAVKDDAVTYGLDDGSIGSLVSLELCLNLMHMSKESLGRVLVMTATLDYSLLKVNAGKVFVKLLQAIGMRHMNPAFQSAIARLDSSTPVDDWSEKAVNVDSLQFFELVHIADLVHQMLDVYFNEDVRPWIDDNDFLSDVMIEKKSYDRNSDNNVAHGMDKAIQVLINQVDHILETKQVPQDYNPPNEGVYDFKPTKACLSAIACLNAHTRLLNGVTNKETLEVFFHEVGVRMFNVILKNLKKQQVSQSGALQLICDMNKYYEWASSLRVGSVSRLYQVLKELGSLFMADGGEELRNLVHDAERYQGALRPEEIYELLASRTDYKKIQKYVETKECIVM